MQHVREGGILSHGHATPYGDILAGNMRAERARARLSQEAVAARMQALGFSAWRYQTVGVVESGKRHLMAEEVIALAWVLETTIATLMSLDFSGQSAVLPLALGPRDEP